MALLHYFMCMPCSLLNQAAGFNASFKSKIQKGSRVWSCPKGASIKDLSTSRKNIPQLQNAKSKVYVPLGGSPDIASLLSVGVYGAHRFGWGNDNLTTSKSSLQVRRLQKQYPPELLGLHFLTWMDLEFQYLL